MSEEVSASPVAIADLKYEDVSQLNFSKLYSPKMKSVYWRYFGFPSNDNNEVITKQNVVCIKCHKVLTNHGNTTNLRAHLQHRHKDLFKELCQEHDIHVPPRKTPRNVTHPPLSKRNVSSRRVKLEFINNRNHDNASDEEMDEAAVATAAMQAEEDASSQTMLYETMVPFTYDEAENLVEEEDQRLVMEPKYGRKRKVATPSSTLHGRAIKHEDGGYTVANIANLAEALTDIMIKDLRNVEFLYDAGFSDFVRQAMGGSAHMPEPHKIESLISEMHASKFLEVGEITREFTSEKPFSFAFEHWVNVEQRRFLSIFHHYLDEETQSVKCMLYATVEYTEYIVLDDLLTDFYLPNCTLAIINYDDEEDLLYTYLREKNIPIALCYVSVIDKCLRRVFELDEVAPLLDQVKELMQRHSSEIASKVSELPPYNEHFPWTLYETLKFFAESISWSEDMDQLVISAKTVTEALSALVIALDTLRGEDIPLCSMLSPITSKILIKKLGIAEQDDPLMMNVKRTISGVLQAHIISNDNLTAAALLDPRFHRLTTIDNLERCVRMLTHKYNKNFGGSAEGETNEVATTSSSTVAIKSESRTGGVSAAGKSKLELLFDIADIPTPPKKENDSSVESDLKRYRNEVVVQLDESPIEWWLKMGHVYGTLRDLATLYQSVPGVVTLSFKKALRDQIYDYNKRFMLTGSQIDAILFLHHHNN
ncbi:uncharacterized protein LOC128262834 [Drosophila gunungcola]|uniref:BED-type domain-containing protein n=1 Tax=Drosophila gunungcola TaxID=103775 RepID=A0A9P9YUM8_9MUSC|nr:uncharacterized protein LOC128262834 [Drosophila gunungcola]KAI8043215.1 hypothetical protein M5D96_004542 [Drosophila gunungcola]